jgi:hypothetical protein
MSSIALRNKFPVPLPSSVTVTIGGTPTLITLVGAGETYAVYDTGSGKITLTSSQLKKLMQGEEVTA